MPYKFSENAPPILDERKYFKLAKKEFERLLKECSDDETAFQTFFEQNPSFLPGARDEYSGIGPSGHGPHLQTLISQPKITGLINRIPDFMWLASDSVYFTPVIVEIEAPNKMYFKKDGTPTAHFTHSRHQLEEWQTILSRPENILKFYQDFSIPSDLIELTFKPYFILIYGRRKEYVDSLILKQKRGAIIGQNQTIMSFDRINPSIAERNYTCTTVKDGEYIAKYLSPTFHLGPFEEQLLEIKNLAEVVDNTAFINKTRKTFLKNKIPKCIDYLKNGNEHFILPKKGDFKTEE